MSKFVIYKSKLSKRRNWYWHFKSSNGLIQADSGEGYLTRWNAKRGLKRFIDSVKTAEIQIKK